uniref:SSD domain-containing protein n=1 Tax=Strigamia maritima TaxID=126957 RepID=T1IK20_STRMM
MQDHLLCEDGRLEKEMEYIRKNLGDGAWDSNQIILHLPKQDGANILHVDSMLAHLDAVLAATQVHVEMFDAVWKLKDLCVSPTYPSFEDGVLEQIFEKLMPCAIITPLDCFWEGSKVVGPDYPIQIPEWHGGPVQWSNLNPMELLKLMKLTFTSPSDSIESFMKRAGVTTAYQEKPCLNPLDPECPNSAPNKKSKSLPDVSTELNGGCKGVAARYMHWPEELIVGGVKKNRTGHIMRAKAIQTIIPLMGERQMHEFWKDNYKVHNLNWNEEKAKEIIETWQRKFASEVQKHVAVSNLTKHQRITAFSTTSLSDILRDFSEINVTKIVLGYLFMLIYTCVSLLRWSNVVHSQSGIGLVGVLLVAMSIAAGLGFCALIGITFNASTTQIVPFLALGLGVDDIFLLTHTYAENVTNEISVEEETGECLKQTGLSILLTSVSNMFAFFAAAIIPIPALRAFALQAGILTVFNISSSLLIFPAVVSLDLRRRESKRIDIFCCFASSQTEKTTKNTPILPTVDPAAKRHQTVTRTVSPDGHHVTTVLAQDDSWPVQVSSSPSVESLATTCNSTSTRELVADKGDSFKDRWLYGCLDTQNQCYVWSLTCFARDFYGPNLQKTPVKVLSMLGFICLLALSIWGALRVSNGLDLTDIVPHDSSEYRFLHAQNEFFGFYNMFAVTQGNFEYPTNQKLLQEYHDAFVRVENVVKNDDGGLPDFWLSMFRQWLKGLQDAFDEDWTNGCISQEWWYKNASSDGVLAYKLLVQTGQVDNPVDKSLVTKVRLVNDDGIINPKAFYNYLTAWVSNDPLIYSASMANLRPEPKMWIHDARDYELKIGKSQPLVYTQLPFYLNKLSTTEQVTTTIEAVRDICQRFEQRGLPNFPTGIPFTYWEQYLSLRFHLFLALLCVLAAIFIVLSVVLVNPWAAMLVVLVLAAIVLQLYGFMGMIGVRLSAVPAVILIVAVGIGVEFTVHVCVGFLTSIGSRSRRICMSLEHTFAPVVHGGLSTLLGVLMLAFSEFDFIVRYFFYVLCALVVIGLINGLLFFPILLSLIGPSAEVIPKDNPDRIATPTPEPSPPRVRYKCKKNKADLQQNRRMYPSEISLSTITEEPPSWQSSHEIVVQPEVVVETTTSYPRNEDKNDEDSSSTNVPNYPTAVTTKVTATAKVKVEVHTPFPMGVNRESNYKHKKRKDDERR